MPVPGPSHVSGISWSQRFNTSVKSFSSRNSEWLNPPCKNCGNRMLWNVSGLEGVFQMFGVLAAWKLENCGGVEALENVYFTEALWVLRGWTLEPIPWPPDVPQLRRGRARAHLSRILVLSPLPTASFSKSMFIQPFTHPFVHLPMYKGFINMYYNAEQWGKDKDESRELMDLLNDQRRAAYTWHPQIRAKPGECGDKVREMGARLETGVINSMWVWRCRGVGLQGLWQGTLPDIWVESPWWKTGSVSWNQ